MTTSFGFPEAFCERLTEELADAGWDRFPFDGSLTLRFTQRLEDGFWAVATVVGSTGRHPGPPMLADVGTGVGYEPATTLMPRLTLRPSPLLLPTGEAPDEAQAEGLARELSSQQDLDRFRAHVVELARDHAVPLARPYATLSAMDAALRAELEDFPESASQTLPVFLAATGRPDEALDEVEEILASDLEDLEEREYRRFARQLRLWVDAGSPPPPPLAAWPVDAFEPPWRATPRATPSERRAERAATRDALDAVRKVARGKSRQELSALLTVEYARRGIDVSPAVVVMQAGMLELEQKPFGKVRVGLTVLKTMATVTRGTVSGLRHALEDSPAWLEPPDDALFEVPATDDAWVSVSIATDAKDWLAHVAADANPTPQLLTHCEAWLRPHETGPIDVFIGQQRVGHMDGPAADSFRSALAAAARYQELPVVRAQLLWSDDEAERSLALARPASVPQPPPF